MSEAVRFVPELDPAAVEVLDGLVADKVASRIASQDETLWGPDAEHEASVRLSWVGLAESSRPLLAEIEALRADLLAEGVDHVVLAGMGGSSLAPEVITGSGGVELTVLDSTDPAMVARALGDRLERSVLVVSSKSGTTVETDSQRRAYLGAFAAAGIDGPARIVIVTDPGSPLVELAEQEGYRKTFLADPDVGGRYSALTAFGLVPSGLAGADIAGLLDDAAAIMPDLANDDVENPALRLGAALGAAHAAGREKVVLGAGTLSGVEGFPAWAEQLIAESTGKLGKGLLPVDVEQAGRPGWAQPAVTITRAGIGSTDGDLPHVDTTAGLGALMLLWETAVAVAGRVIGINPFDQPNVEEAKKAARALLDQTDDTDDSEPAEPALTDGAVQVFGDAAVLGGAGDLASALKAIAGAVPTDGYLAVMAYLDRTGDDAPAAGLRDRLATDAPFEVTFGWGPRFLHSTGQYHKGGHPNGAFVQITGAHASDLAVPDRPYTFGTLIDAQAAGDRGVLAGKGFPVFRLHLTDRVTGLAQLLAAV